MDEERNGEKEHFLHEGDAARENGRVDRKRSVWSYVRLACEVLLLVTIALLLSRPPSAKPSDRVLRSPVPTCMSHLSRAPLSCKG